MEVSTILTNMFYINTNADPNSGISNLGGCHKRCTGKHAVSAGLWCRYNSLNYKVKYHCSRDTSSQQLQIRKASSGGTRPSLPHRLPSPVPTCTMMEGLSVCFQRASTGSPKMTKTQHLLHVASYYSQTVNTPQRREENLKIETPTLLAHRNVF